MSFVVRVSAVECGEGNALRVRLSGPGKDRVRESTIERGEVHVIAVNERVEISVAEVRKED